MGVVSPVTAGVTPIPPGCSRPPDHSIPTTLRSIHLRWLSSKRSETIHLKDDLSTIESWCFLYSIGMNWGSFSILLIWSLFHDDTFIPGTIQIHVGYKDRTGSGRT